MVAGSRVTSTKRAEIASRERLESQRIDQRYRSFRSVVKTGGVVACVWFAFQAVGKLAGERTDVVVETALSVVGSADLALSVSLTGVVAAWAVAERWLRQRAVQRLEGRIRELETQIDPSRSSSMLTARGKTNPKDRD